MALALRDSRRPVPAGRYLRVLRTAGDFYDLGSPFRLPAHPQGHIRPRGGAGISPHHGLVVDVADRRNHRARARRLGVAIRGTLRSPPHSVGRHRRSRPWRHAVDPGLPSEEARSEGGSMRLLTAKKALLVLSALLVFPLLTACGSMRAELQGRQLGDAICNLKNASSGDVQAKADK